ncbi:prepilin-type N-terminal cleavage/methylation domain-containing protein [Ferrovum sp. PN-J185]|uniref:prepilin-type N-terminal cleavage/methylation domain-containing protein n=1 Tax=Ferrovum sp. PN-J185 TaxID=1356306 RepID=UPI00079B6C77|nr:prepilin-type N-terminal cleavage/methylation domain-containing protein [Ferrovum sp. PN-J185]KXW56494.1 hypothetical protein FV185_04430 [Ferrovum sp. PN-J185]MCC6068157.1 prepilin-type N-terminal cleavage/methylation domain-containing protein [Ferrovum sp. PN-J185]MDE1891730.1 prepilin-type N-terminal cleavage/methylation domain-containing protein [Betaproteobacteria bacterium]MDE2056428.1 prepilin-type N-terminal cleavage/methylation domain-containing protein [Betaproteobacteria bacterium
MTQTLVTGDKQLGFSLIELLVVLVIIGISFSLITLSIHVVDPSHLSDDATRLVATINQAHDIEDLTGSPVVMKIDCHNWRFFDTSSGELKLMDSQQVAGGQFKSTITHIQVNDSELNCPEDNSLTIIIGDDISPIEITLITQQHNINIISDTLGRFRVIHKP